MRKKAIEQRNLGELAKVTINSSEYFQEESTTGTNQSRTNATENNENFDIVLNSNNNKSSKNADNIGNLPHVKLNIKRQIIYS